MTPDRRRGPDAPRVVTAGLTGTLLLARLVVRRDRVRMIVSVLAVAAFYAYFALALDTVFADPQALAGRAALMETPAGVVLSGPGYGVESYSTGAALANEGTTWVVLALGLLGIQHVVRHTRAEEDSGHADLVGSGAIGRHAPAAAAVLTLAGLLLAVAAVSSVALVAVAGVPVPDVLGLTLGAAVSALVLGAVALVACQVLGQARPAVGAAAGFLGLALVIRAAGDLQQRGGSPLSWLSPIAWAQQVRPFVDLRWWPLALGIGLSALLLVVAFALATRRDLGGGLLEVGRGRAHARPGLRSPWGLAWAQQRGTLLACAVGMGAVWFGTGTLLTDIDALVSDLAVDNPLVQAVFGSDVDQVGRAFLGVMVLYAALCCAAYAVTAAARPAAEEEAGRAEVVLALPVSRGRWLGASLAVAGAGSALLLAIGVGALWLGALTTGVGGPSLPDHLGVFASYLPAVLLFAALTGLLVAWAPRARSAMWGLLVLALVLGLFAGALPQLPDAVAWVSPFHWVPAAYVDPVDPVETAGLVAAVVLTLAAALIGIRRRDIRSA